MLHCEVVALAVSPMNSRRTAPRLRTLQHSSGQSSNAQTNARSALSADAAPVPLPGANVRSTASGSTAAEGCQSFKSSNLLQDGSPAREPLADVVEALQKKGSQLSRTRADDEASGQAGSPASQPQAADEASEQDSRPSTETQADGKEALSQRQPDDEASEQAGSPASQPQADDEGPEQDSRPSSETQADDKEVFSQPQADDEASEQDDEAPEQDSRPSSETQAHDKQALSQIAG